jgi:hypothetical protein
LSNLLSKIINRIKLVTVLYLNFISNLRKSNSQTRPYVIRRYFQLFFDYTGLSNFMYKHQLIQRAKKIKLNDTIVYHNALYYAKIVYINLPQRIDRKIFIEGQFSKIGISNYSRFNAIFDEIGIRGCALSHIKVIQDWDVSKEPLLIIFEDDIEISWNKAYFNKILNQFLSNDQLDILHLSGKPLNSYRINEHFHLSSKIYNTAAYVIKPHMKVHLIAYFTLSSLLITQNIDKELGTALDSVWHELQRNFNFVIPIKFFGNQIVSYSDISYKVVDYSN